MAAFIFDTFDLSGNPIQQIHDDPDNLMKIVNGVLVYKTQAELDADALQELADATNPALKAQLAELDLRRIRPLATGDNIYLGVLQSQIDALVLQLVRDVNGVVL